jgi:peptidoglycan hydrolase-like protein with peptidoglycan-binding domain
MGKFLLMLKIALLTICGFSLFAQAPKPVVGTVVAADAAAKTLSIKADDGTETKVQVVAGAQVSQIPPGETSLKAAKPTELSAVTAGDRVLARGPVTDGVMNATLVVLMSSKDIAKKQQQEQALWATKGISGIVTAVDKSANLVTLNVRGTDGVKAVKVTLAEKANVKRYAEGSVKFADAVASSIAEIDVNDQVRALGTKSEDGLSYKADQVVSGAFRNIAATVRSVDLANGVIEVTDLDTKKPVFVKVSKEANVKKLPEMAATMMAMAINGGFSGMPGMGGRPGGAAPGAAAPGAGAPGAGGPPAGAAMRPGGGAPGAGGPPAGMGGGMRRPGGDMMGMAIDRAPAIQLSDLKKDDPLILSVSKTKEANKVVAITILAGVEAILATPANGSRATQLGTWNLDGGAGMMGGGGGGGMGGPPQ